MNWVTIDLGASTIKASVRDNKRFPVRLLYRMGAYYTTLLSAEVFEAENGEIVIGDLAAMQGCYEPSLIISDWKAVGQKNRIVETFLGTIHSSAIDHYGDNEIGAVILYNNTPDEMILGIANKIFRQVKSMCVADVMKKAIAQQSKGLMLIADFGAKAFRTTVINLENDKTLFVENKDLSFSSLEIFSLIEIDKSRSHNSIERSLLGLMMQMVKIAVNKGGEVVLPYGISSKGSLKDDFERMMTDYLHKCFEESFEVLRTMNKTWSDVSEVVFIGGGAESCIINRVFENYMLGLGLQLKSFNSSKQDFDTQFAASYCAIQMPLREETGVIIEF